MDQVDDEEEIGDMRTRMVRAKSPVEQCGGIQRRGGNQCPYTKVPGSEYCIFHGGASMARSLAKKAAKLYDIGKYRARLDRMEGSEAGTRLVEELAILRMSLEALVNKGDEVELSNNSPKISLLCKEIRETLKVDTSLKKDLGELMDKAKMQKLAAGFVGVIVKHVDPTKLQVVQDELAKVMAELL